MIETTGGVRKARGRWQAVFNFRIAGTDLSRRMTRMTDVPCQDDCTRGKKLAQQQREDMLASAIDEFCSSISVEEFVGLRLDGGAVDVPAAISDIIERRFAAKQIAEETYKSYRYSLKHIARAFTGVAPSEVTPAAIRAWIDEAVAAGTSLDVLNRARVLMSSAFKTFLAEGAYGVAANPVEAVPKLRVLTKPQNPLSQNSIAMLNRRLACMPDSFLLRAAVCALHTGMRRGEICALRWRDMDWDEDRIRIAYSLYVSESGAIVIKDTKGHECRWAPIDVLLRTLLRSCYEADIASMVAMGISEDKAARSILDWHVVSADCGRPLKPERLTREWKGLVGDLGLLGVDGQPPTFHDLRHTFATQWVATGGDIKALSFILGHKDVRTTMDIYVSVDDTSMRLGMDTSSRTLSAGWIGAERLDGRTSERVSASSLPVLLHGDALMNAAALSSRFGISIPDAVFRALELATRETISVAADSVTCELSGAVST